MDNQQESLKLIPIPELSKYYIDNYGNIYSANRGNYIKKLTSRIHYGRSKSPYLRIKVAGKCYLSHRLIASVLKGRQLITGEFVNHKDGNTLNNSLVNLEVVTHKENVAHAIANNLYCSGKEWYLSRGIFNDYPKGVGNSIPEAQGTFMR